MAKRTYKKKHHYIPHPYYKPAMFAIGLFRSYEKSLTDSLQITYMVFTDKESPDYIPRSQLDQRVLRRHVIDWIASD